MRKFLIGFLLFSTLALADSPPGSAASSQNVVPNERDPSHTLYCQERTTSAHNIMEQWVFKGVSKEDFWKYHKIEEATLEMRKELEDYVDRAYSHATDKGSLKFRTEEWERCWAGKNWGK